MSNIDKRDLEKMDTGASSVSDIIAGTRDPSRIQALLELYKEKNLDYNAVYAKPQSINILTKNETWRESVGAVFGLDVNHGFTKAEFDIDEEKIVKVMDSQFMLKSQSLKAKRSDQIVTALKNDYGEMRGISENKPRRKLFGIF